MAPYTEFFSWGSDQYGQLALANSDDDDSNQYYPPQYYEEPKSLSFDILISSISCGDHHAAFISGDGFLFSFGRNTEGQLGVGDPSLMKSSAPLLVDSLPSKDMQIVQVSCGGSHTAVLLSNGEIFSWGQGQYGATGLNTQQNTFAPLKIKSSENQNTTFINVSCGKRHSMAVDIEGQVYVTGDNQFRQLGISHTERVLAFKLVNGFYKKAMKVSAGVEHSMILTREGEIYAAGNNTQGNLGLGHTYSSDSFLQVHGLQNMVFTTISAGRHSSAITDDNRLFVWGPVFQNESALILPQELRSNKLIKWVDIGEKHSAIIDEDYHLYTWSSHNDSEVPNQEGQMPQFVESLAYKQVTQVAVGQDFIIALGQDFDSNGQIMPREFSSPIQDQSASFQKDNNMPLQSQKDNKYDSYQKQFQDEKSFENFPQRHQQEERDNKYEPKSSSKPPLLKNHDKNPSQTFDYDYNRKSEKEPYYDNNRNNNSQISNSSKKSNPVQNNRIVYDPKDESSFVSSQVAFDRNNSADKFKHTGHYSNQPQPQLGSSSSQGFNYASNTNAELYKQIDQLREENFQLKAKQRELMKALNELKIENEQLLQNADQEIKRMSDFVDKYTQEVDTNKKKMEKEFEDKIQNERKKTEELKQKFYKDQNDIESKLDKLQREIENQRQENLTLQQQKFEAIQRQRELQDQLNHSNQQLKQVLMQSNNMQPSDRDNRNHFSPLSNSTPMQTKSIKFDETSRQTTPSNYNQRPPATNNLTQERSNPRLLKDNRPTQEYNQDQQQPQAPRQQHNQRGQNYENIGSFNSNNRPVQYQQDEPNRYQRQQKDDSSQNFFTIDTKNNYSPFNNTKLQKSDHHNQSIGPTQSSINTMSNNKMPVISPQRQQDQSDVKRSFMGGQYQTDDRSQYDNNNFGYQKDSRDNNNFNNHGRTFQEPQQLKNDYRSGQYSSLQKSQYNPAQENSLQNSMARRETPQDQKYMRVNEYNGDDSMVSSSNIKGKENNAHSRGASVGGEDKNALNDVKNRLLIMQRNKEELEEKLRNYENKIRQHYNRQ